jgi:hypothetical protein
MRHALLTLAFLLAPRLALACPVCFGQNDSPLSAAVNTGVILMLGVVGAVLGGFASFIVYLIRRAKLAGDLEADRSGPGAAPHPQEGTARC